MSRTQVEGTDIRDGSITGADISTTSTATFTVAGHAVVNSNLQLTGGDFSTLTGLRIWNMDGGSSGNQIDVVTGTTLTLTGTLTTSTDVLGEVKYNTFNGSTTFLSSSDIDICNNMNGDFSVGVWVKTSDWTPSTTAYIISRYTSSGGNNGWQLSNTIGGYIEWETQNASVSTSNIAYNISYLAPNVWHHIAVVRDADTGTYLYVNGELVSATVDASQVIGNGGTFDVGAGQGGGLNFFAGSLDEIYVAKGVVLIADEVKELYARSANKFIVVSKDGTVFKDDSRKVINKNSSVTGNAIPAFDSTDGRVVYDSGMRLNNGGLELGQDNIFHGWIVNYTSGTLTVFTAASGSTYLVCARYANFGGSDPRGGTWFVSATSKAGEVYISTMHSVGGVSLYNSGTNDIIYSGGTGIPSTVLTYTRLV